MTYPYVEARDGALYVGKSRVPLDSIIPRWRAGQSPEAIHESYPSLPLSDLYGAIAYYLEHRDAVDAWLRDTEELWRAQGERQEAEHGAFLAMMRERFALARQRLGLEERAPAAAAPEEQAPMAGPSPS
jgi:uncharacterized protein (DUF433 family)